jgi:hypothetical protein
VRSYEHNDKASRIGAGADCTRRSGRLASDANSCGGAVSTPFRSGVAASSALWFAVAMAGCEL